MGDPTPFEAARARIGTPADRAACFVRSWALDVPEYRIAFQGLEDSLCAQFELAEASARSKAFEEAAKLCEETEKAHRDFCNTREHRDARGATASGQAHTAHMLAVKIRARAKEAR